MHACLEAILCAHPAARYTKEPTNQSQTTHCAPPRRNDLTNQSQPETGDYGGAYFGNGLPNTDLQFML